MTYPNNNPEEKRVSKEFSGKKVILVVLDGWGLGNKDRSNPLFVANPPTVNYIKQNFPLVTLQASGIAVGLPWQEEGNSEIGHLTIGAGRVIYQPYPKITMAIKDGLFFKNKALLEAFSYAKENNVNLHFIGLFGEANVHSSLEHLKALVKMAEENNFQNFRLHLITDGRDSEPEAALKLLKEVPENNISSLSGRFYAMDRDNYLDRTAAAFEVMLGNGPISPSAKGAIELSYSSGITDETLKPVVIGDTNNSIKPKDAIIFFNFREERMKQLVKMMIDKLPEAHLVSFTEYDSSFQIPVAFPAETIDNPLGKVISDKGLNQLRLAESEKEAHVTFFFNGQKAEPFPNEYRVIIPSRKTSSHAKFPEMMAEEITARATSAIEEGIYSFILINYANPDMVAHTGDFNACLKAVETVDNQIKALMTSSLATDSFLLITADHGNVERVLNPYTGEPETKHDASPVPFYLIGNGFQKMRTLAEAEEIEKEIVGSLADIAPTVLELLNIEKPAEMSGDSLIPFLND